MSGGFIQTLLHAAVFLSFVVTYSILFGRFLINQFSINELTGFNNTGNVCKYMILYCKSFAYDDSTLMMDMCVDLSHNFSKCTQLITSLLTLPRCLAL